MEHKTLQLSDCEIKVSGDSGHFKGYASVFGGVDSYGDTILPGAYKVTLQKNGMPKMFVLHKSYELPIGKWLKAFEDKKGLYVEGELTPNMRMSGDVHAALKHGTLDGLSIGYALKKGDYAPSDQQEGGRIIKTISLLSEVSPVTFPADGDARIDLSSVKSEILEITSIKEFERYLRDAGDFSREVAKALTSQAKDLFILRDADDSELSKPAIEALSKRFKKLKVPS